MQPDSCGYKEIAKKSIENLLDALKSLGSKKANTEICLFGGADVLKREDDTIVDKLIFSIFEITEGEKLNIKNIAGRIQKTHCKIDFAFGKT